MSARNKRDMTWRHLGIERTRQSRSTAISQRRQLLFEETYLAAIRTLARMLTNDNIQTGNLCLSGGTAELPKQQSDLARGTVRQRLYRTHLRRRRPRDRRGTAYLSQSFGAASADRNDVTNAVFGYSIWRVRSKRRWKRRPVLSGANLTIQPPPPRRISLATRSSLGSKETKPTTGAWTSLDLGRCPQRGQLAAGQSCQKGANYAPFAPIVLAEKAADWFDGCPMPSPYMLFTATVRSTDLPAITHVDSSSRIQTVDASCGGIRHVLEAFDRETGVPVLMNTSFNGPGEPIVETPAHAVAFLQDPISTSSISKVAAPSAASYF